MCVCIGRMLQGQYTSWCTLLEQFVSEVHTMRSSNLSHFVPASWCTNSNQLNFMHQVTGTEQNVFTEMGVPHTVTAISPCNMFPNGGTPRFWPKKSLSQSSPSVMFFLVKDRKVFTVSTFLSL